MQLLSVFTINFGVAQSPQHPSIESATVLLLPLQSSQNYYWLAFDPLSGGTEPLPQASPYDRVEEIINMKKKELPSSGGLQLFVDDQVWPTTDVQNYKVNRNVLLASSTVKNNILKVTSKSAFGISSVLTSATGTPLVSGIYVHVFTTTP
jgi:hypothetical protein